jgi:TolA-binding protein
MTRSQHLSVCILSLFFCILPLSVFAESAASSELNRGLALFKQNEFGQAIVFFEGLVDESRGSVIEAEAAFWLAKSYMAARDLDNAAASMEYFLANFPDHPLFPEAYYQKGRLLYLQGEFENAILVFEDYIKSYPDQEFIPNAYYWIGEALYALGALDDAASVFNRVVASYPQSFKVEAARYRLALIDFKKRENELMKLLKWSHEETLKTIEEFQRREKAYEQAIASYQRQVTLLKQQAGTAPSAAVASGEGAAALQTLKAENARLMALVDSLQKQLQATRTEGGSAAGAAGPEMEELLRLQELLKIKEEALKLKESLIDWSERNPGSK